MTTGDFKTEFVSNRLLAFKINSRLEGCEGTVSFYKEKRLSKTGRPFLSIDILYDDKYLVRWVFGLNDQYEEGRFYLSWSSLLKQAERSDYFYDTRPFSTSPIKGYGSILSLIEKVASRIKGVDEREYLSRK